MGLVELIGLPLIGCETSADDVTRFKILVILQISDCCGGQLIFFGVLQLMYFMFLEILCVPLKMKIAFLLVLLVV